jgi:hypothetical protein
MPPNRNRLVPIQPHRVVKSKLFAIALLSAAAVCAPAGTALAATSSGSQYGPPGVTTPAPEGGFTTIVTTVTIGPEGGTIGPIAVDGVELTITVPDGAFASPVQITVTAPDLATIPPMTGTTVTAGAGITVSQNGALYPGTFLAPITATFASPHITAGSVVTVWNGSSFVTDPSSTSTAGTASVSFDSDPDFAVMTPVTTPPKRVPGATAPVTGVPVLGEGLLAGGLILGGAGGIAASRRRRARASSARD